MTIRRYILLLNKRNPDAAERERESDRLMKKAKRREREDRDTKQGTWALGEGHPWSLQVLERLGEY